MNKSFKVVFNKARGALMVVNEVTSSVQAKGTKTVIAAAVATLMAGAAVAGLPEGGVITNDKLPTIDGVKNPETTKLVAGHGQTVNIQTSASVGDFANKVSEALQKPGLDKITGIYDALQPDGTNVILTGVSGGGNVMDSTSATLINFAGSTNIIPKKFTDRLLGAFDYKAGLFQPAEDQKPEKAWSKDTNIIIGSEDKNGSNPIVIGVVGGDFYASLTGQETPKALQQEYGTKIDIANGNIAGVIGGSSAIVAKLVTDDSKPASLTTVSVTDTDVTLHGYSNVGGVIAGGLATALQGSNVNSNVIDGTKLTINMKDDAKAGHLDGLVIGGLGGGLAVAFGKSNASVNNGKSTTINVVNGEVIGLILKVGEWEH